MHAQADSRTGSAPAFRRARWVYVGSRTERERNAQGEGISIYRMDTSTGEWALSEVAGGMVNPSFLAFDRTGRYLYTVHGKHSGITAFRVDRQTGRLTRIGHQPTEVNPVHLAPDPTNRYMVVANLDSGSLASLPIHADGTLGPMSDVVKLSGKPGSGKTWRPDSSGPHHCPPDRSGRFIIVPDKGLDAGMTAWRCSQSIRRAARSRSRDGSRRGARNRATSASIPREGSSMSPMRTATPW